MGSTAYAEILWVDGGLLGPRQVSGTYAYQELCFVTGEPILLKGLVKLPVVDKTKENYQEKYTFELLSSDGKISLKRAVTFDITTLQSPDKTQSVFTRKIQESNSAIKYEETITTPNGVYTLAECSFSDSRTYANSLAAKYFNGNIDIYKKTYYKNGTVNKNEGKIEIAVGSSVVTGYENIWGSNETQKTEYHITSYKPNTVVDPQNPYLVEWDGTFEIGMNSTKKINFDFQYTQPQNIPFRRNFYKVTQRENVLSYTYNLPKSTDATSTLKGRNIGKVNLSQEPFVESAPLFVPSIRDIQNHWAEEEIMLLTSLELFDIEQEYFVPSAYISRMDFAKAVVGAVQGKLPEPTRTEVVKRQRPGVETPYLDVDKNDPDYHYMEFVKSNDVMYGKNGYFKGQETLTRAEAIAILIRALGIQNLAPTPPYKTGFVDDNQIPEWAKDHIYMANEIGLVTGTPDGYINPNARVTKAEAAIMLYDFIHHLKDVINYDYREKVLSQ